MMKVPDEKPGLSFYLGWMLLNILAVVIAWYIAFAVLSLIIKIVGERIVINGQSRITEDALFMYVLLPIIGLLIGIAQYTLIRRYLPRIAGWIPVSILGWIMPFVIGFVVSSLFTPGNSTLWIMGGLLVIGAGISLPQWLLLRRRVSHSYLWIFAYGISWSLVGILNTFSNDPFAVLLAISLIPTAATAIAWWFFLDRFPRGALQASG